MQNNGFVIKSQGRKALFCAKVQVETRALRANTPLFYNGWSLLWAQLSISDLPWRKTTWFKTVPIEEEIKSQFISGCKIFSRQNMIFRKLQMSNSLQNAMVDIKN